MDHEVALPLRALRWGGGTDVFVTLSTYYIYLYISFKLLWHS